MGSGKSIRSWSVVTPAEELNKGSSSGATPAAFRRALTPDVPLQLPAYQPEQRPQAPIIDNDTGQQVNDLSPQVAAMSSPIIDNDTGQQVSNPVPLYRAANAPVIDNDTGLRANAFTPAPLMEQGITAPPPSFNIGQGIGESDPRKPINVGAGPRPFQPPIYTNQAGLYDEAQATEELQARLEKENQGRFRQVTSNIAAGGLGGGSAVLSTIAEKTGAEIGGLRADNIRKLSNSLAAQWGTNYKEKPGGTLWDKALDPDWYATTVAQGAGSLAGSAAIAAIASVPMAALGTVIAPLGVAMGLSEGAIALSISAYRFGGNAAIDSLLEMASAYSDSRRSGKSIEEANRIANTVGANNMLYAAGAGVAGLGLAKFAKILGGTAAAQRLAASSPVRATLESRLVQNGFSQAAVREGSALTERAVKGGNEWLQERQQGEIQKAAEENRPWDFVRGVLSRDYEDDGVIGALGAIASGLAGSVVGGALRRGRSGAVSTQQAVDASLGARANQTPANQGAPAQPELGVPSRRELEESTPEVTAILGELEREDEARQAAEPEEEARQAGSAGAPVTTADVTAPAGAKGLDFSGQDLRERQFTEEERQGSLYGANFEGANLTSIKLPTFRLGGINFANVKFNNADLNGADLQRSVLTGANLTDAKFQNANLTDADLTSADLTNANLKYANLSFANLTRANLDDANLTGANLNGADLQRSVLTGANLTDAKFQNANLTGANLTGASLTGANLTGASLTGANLSGASFSNADLIRANFRRANLSNVNFRQADMTGVDLRDANIEGADFEGAFIVDKNDNTVPFVAPISNGAPASTTTLASTTASEESRTTRVGYTESNKQELIQQRNDLDSGKVYGTTVNEEPDAASAGGKGSDGGDGDVGGGTVTPQPEDYSGRDLEGINFSERDLTDAKFQNANLTSADLTGADLTSADLTNANLKYANLSFANLDDANLTGANLNGAKMEGASMTGVSLQGTLLQNTILIDVDLTKAQMYGVKLNNANLQNAKLTDADLRNADLTDADLSKANLTGADLTGADLTGTNLTGAYTVGNRGKRVPYSAPAAARATTPAPATPAPVTNAPVTNAPVTNAPATGVRGAASAESSGKSDWVSNILALMAEQGGSVSSDTAKVRGGFANIGDLEKAAARDGRIVFDDAEDAWVPAPGVELPEVTPERMTAIKAEEEAAARAAEAGARTAPVRVAGSGGIDLIEARDVLIGNAVSVKASVPVYDPLNPTSEISKMMKVGNIIDVRDDPVEGRQVRVSFAYENYPSMWVNSDKVSKYAGRDPALPAKYPDVTPLTKEQAAERLAAEGPTDAGEIREPRAARATSSVTASYKDNRDAFLGELDDSDIETRAFDIEEEMPAKKTMTMRRTPTSREVAINPMAGSTEENFGKPLEKQETLTRLQNGDFNPEWRINFDLKRFYMALESGNDDLARAYAEAMLNGSSAYGLGILLADVNSRADVAKRPDFRPETLIDGLRSEQATAIADALLAIKYLFDGDQAKIDKATLQMINGFRDKSISSIDGKKYKITYLIRDAVTNVNEVGSAAATTYKKIPEFSESNLKLLESLIPMRDKLKSIVRNSEVLVRNIAREIMESPRSSNRRQEAIKDFNKLNETDKLKFEGIISTEKDIDGNEIQDSKYPGDTAFNDLENMKLVRESDVRKELKKVQEEDKEAQGFNATAKQISEMSLTELLEALNNGTYDQGTIIASLKQASSAYRAISDKSYSAMLALAMRELGENPTQEARVEYSKKINALLNKYFHSSRSKSTPSMAQNLVNAIAVKQANEEAVIKNTDNYVNKFAEFLSNAFVTRFNYEYNKFSEAQDTGSPVNVRTIVGSEKVSYSGKIVSISDLAAGKGVLVEIEGTGGSKGNTYYVKITSQNGVSSISMTNESGETDGEPARIRREVATDATAPRPTVAREIPLVPTLVETLSAPSVASIVAKKIKSKGNFPSAEAISAWQLGTALSFLEKAARFKDDAAESFIHKIASGMILAGGLSKEKVALALFLNAGTSKKAKEYAEQLRSFDKTLSSRGAISTLERIAAQLSGMTKNSQNVKAFERTTLEKLEGSTGSDRNKIAKAKKAVIGEVLAAWKAHVATAKNFDADKKSIEEVKNAAVRELVGVAPGDVAEGTFADSTIKAVTYDAKDKGSVRFDMDNVRGKGIIKKLKELLGKNVFNGFYINAEVQGRGSGKYRITVTGKGDSTLKDIYDRLGKEKANRIAEGLAETPSATSSVTPSVTPSATPSATSAATPSATSAAASKRRARGGARPSSALPRVAATTLTGDTAKTTLDELTEKIDEKFEATDGVLDQTSADELVSLIDGMHAELGKLKGLGDSEVDKVLDLLEEKGDAIIKMVPSYKAREGVFDPTKETNPLLEDGTMHPDLNRPSYVIQTIDAVLRGEEAGLSDEGQSIVAKLRAATAEDIDNYLRIVRGNKEKSDGKFYGKTDLYNAIISFVTPWVAEKVTPIGAAKTPSRVATSVGAAPASTSRKPRVAATGTSADTSADTSVDTSAGASVGATSTSREPRAAATGAAPRIRMTKAEKEAAEKEAAKREAAKITRGAKVTAPVASTNGAVAPRPVKAVPKVRDIPLDNIDQIKSEIVQHIFDENPKTNKISKMEENVIDALLNHESMTLKEAFNLLGGSTSGKALRTLADLNIASFDSATDAYSFNPNYKTGGIRRTEAATSPPAGIAPANAGAGGGGGIVVPPGMRPQSDGGTEGKKPKLPDLPIVDVQQKSPGWFDYLKAFRNASLLSNPIGIVGDLANSVVGNALVLNNARNFVTAAVENKFGVAPEKRVMTYKMARTYANKSIGGIGKGAMDAISAAFNPRQYLDSTSENFTLMTDALEGKTGATAATGRAVLGVLEAGSRVRIAADAMAVSIAKNGFAGAYAENAADMRMKADPSLDKINTFEEERKKIELAMWYWGKLANEGALDAATLVLPSGYTKSDLTEIDTKEWDNKQRLIKQMALNTVYRGEMAEILPDLGNLRANNPVIAFMVPFAQTLARVGYASADAMPIVGQIMLGLDISRGKYGKGATLTEAIQRGMTQEYIKGGRALAAHRVANQVLGLSLAFVGGMLYAMKALMADGPDDDQEKAAWLDEGNRPWSLVIGGTSYNIITLLGPAAAPMMAGAKIYQEYLDDTYKNIEITPEKRNTILGHFEAIGKSTTQWWVNNTILRNFQDILNAAQGRQAADAMQKFGANSLMGFLPGSGLLRYITKQTDPYFRDPQNFLDYVNQNLPIEMRLGDTPVPVKRNDIGQAIQKTATERSAVPLNMSSIRTQRFKTPASDKNSQSPYRMIVSDSAREDYVNYRSYNKVMEFINKKGNAPRPTDAEIELVANIIKRTKEMKLNDPINPLYEIRRSQVKPYIDAERTARANAKSGVTAGGTK